MDLNIDLIPLLESFYIVKEPETCDLYANYEPTKFILNGFKNGIFYCYYEYNKSLYEKFNNCNMFDRDNYKYCIEKFKCITYVNFKYNKNEYNIKIDRNHKLKINSIKFNKFVNNSMNNIIKPT